MRLAGDLHFGGEGLRFSLAVKVNAEESVSCGRGVAEVKARRRAVYERTEMRFIAGEGEEEEWFDQCETRRSSLQRSRGGEGRGGIYGDPQRLLAQSYADLILYL